MFRKVLALTVPLAVAVLAHYEASAQTGPRRDERSGKEVVEAVCTECHATGVKGAPRIGERADWSTRLSQGLPNAVNAAIRGHGGMPARGGKAELTDNEVRSAIIYMFNPATAPKEGAAGAAAAGAAKPAGNVKIVGGTEIYLGVLPAEVLRSFPKDSVERSMHGGVPSGSGHYHVNVSVLDAATKAPISGAKVEINIDERGLSSETKALLPMATGGIPSYGNYIKLKGKTQYVFTVKIQKPDSPQPVETRFEHRVY
ncbi:MAG: c-type cytochrome [Burkholderiaceae bacterium]